MGGFSFARRLERVEALETLFASYPTLRNMRPTGEPMSSMNSRFQGFAPMYVDVVDEAGVLVRAGGVEPAVLKPPGAQAPQEAFMAARIRAHGVEDLFATIGHHSDDSGVLVERAKGSPPRSRDHLIASLIAKHRGSQHAELRAEADLQRFAGVRYLYADPDGSRANMNAWNRGALGYDHGMIGAGTLHTYEPTLVRFHADLIPAHSPIMVRAPHNDMPTIATSGAHFGAHPTSTHADSIAVPLTRKVIDDLLEDFDPQQLLEDHADTLGSWRPPPHPDLVEQTAYVASVRYVDDVVARVEHLDRTGTINIAPHV